MIDKNFFEKMYVNVMKLINYKLIFIYVWIFKLKKQIKCTIIHDMI